MVEHDEDGKPQLCDCEHCRTQRVLYSKTVEAEIAANRARVGLSAPALPEPTTFSTYRLQ